MQRTGNHNARRNRRRSPVRFVGIAVAAMVLAGAVLFALLPKAEGLLDTGTVPSDPPQLKTADINTIGVPLRELLREHGMNRPMDISLEAVKSARLLRFFSEGIHIKSYVIALGSNPVPPKTKRGDNATPEGLYYVCEKNPGSSYHKSLKLSYPGVRDAKRGLDSGLITRSQHDAIVRAVARGRTPPMDTALGGDICIHGGGGCAVTSKGEVAVYDWTQGCIALSNDDVDELFAVVPVGTPVKIKP